MNKICALCYEEVFFLKRNGECERCSEIIRERKMSKAKVLWLRDGKRCRYCGKKITFKNSTVDHIKPKSKGGSNTYANMVNACKTCNEKKSNRTLKAAKMEILQVPGNYFKTL